MSKFMEEAMYSFLKDDMLQKYTPRLREWNIHVSDVTGCLYRSALNRFYLPPMFPQSLGRMYEGIMWEDVTDKFLKSVLGTHLHNPSFISTVQSNHATIPMIATPDFMWSQGRYTNLMEVKRSVYMRRQVTDMSSKRYEAHADAVRDITGYIFAPPQLEKDDYVWETYLLQLAGYHFLLTHGDYHIDDIKLNVIYNDQIKFYDVDPSFLTASDPELSIFSYRTIFLMRAYFLSYFIKPDMKDKLQCLYWYEMTNPVGIFNGVFCKSCPFFHNGMCKGRLPLHTRMANIDEYHILENLATMGILNEPRPSYKSAELHEILRNQYEYGMRMLNEHCKGFPYTTLPQYNESETMHVVSIEPTSEKEVKEMIE